MANLRDLANNIEKLGQHASEKASRVTANLALKMLEELIEATPVDTTKALSNWQLSVGKPANRELAAYAPGMLGYTTSASSAATLAAGRAAIAEKKPGQSIFLSNLAPYIRKLNEGSSKQAPKGFIEMAVARARAMAGGRMR